MLAVLHAVPHSFNRNMTRYFAYTNRKETETFPDERRCRAKCRGKYRGKDKGNISAPVADFAMGFTAALTTVLGATLSATFRTALHATLVVALDSTIRRDPGPRH